MQQLPELMAAYHNMDDLSQPHNMDDLSQTSSPLFRMDCEPPWEEDQSPGNYFCSCRHASNMPWPHHLLQSPESIFVTDHNDGRRKRSRTDDIWQLPSTRQLPLATVEALMLMMTRSSTFRHSSVRAVHMNSLKRAHHTAAHKSMQPIVIPAYLLSAMGLPRGTLS